MQFFGVIFSKNSNNFRGEGQKGIVCKKGCNVYAGVFGIYKIKHNTVMQVWEYRIC